MLPVFIGDSAILDNEGSIPRTELLDVRQEFNYLVGPPAMQNPPDFTHFPRAAQKSERPWRLVWMRCNVAYFGEASGFQAQFNSIEYGILTTAFRGASARAELWSDALAMRGRVVGLRRLWLRRGQKKDHRHHRKLPTNADGRANPLEQVHIIKILSSLSFSLRSLVDNTQTQQTAR